MEGGSQAQPFTGQLAHCAGKQTREWRHLHRPPPHTWLQNIHVPSELSLVFRIVACFRTAILRRVSRVFRISVGGVGSLLQLDHGHTQHARLQACTEYRGTSGILL